MDELLDVFRGRLTVGREAKGVEGVEDTEEVNVVDDVGVESVWVADVEDIVGLVVEEEEDDEEVDIIETDWKVVETVG